MSLDGGLGDVVKKNVNVNEGNLVGNYLTSIRHTNGIDWWIIDPNLNRGFYKILLDESGFSACLLYTSPSPRDRG